MLNKNSIIYVPKTNVSVQGTYANDFNNNSSKDAKPNDDKN